MDVAEPVQVPASADRNLRLSGVIDLVRWPALLSGWVANDGLPELAGPVGIRISIGGQLVGEGVCGTLRPDVRSPHGTALGFAVECIAALPPEALALGQIKVDAADTTGRTGRLHLADEVRGPAFTRLLMSAPAVGRGSAQAILSWLAASPSLHAASREAIQQVVASLRPVVAAAPAAGKTAAPSDPTLEAERRFWFRFESLGADCVLGSMQRHFSSEPLGLLRFTGIGIDAVTTAVLHDFAGVGEAEFTRLVANDHHEYMSSDTRYHMHSHTFIFEGEAPYDALFQRQCQKLRYLARNLVEDIAEGSKIFVVHNLPETLDTPRLDRLAAALRAKGPGWLLYVSRPDAHHPAGSARQVAERVIHGRVLYGEEVAPAAAANSWRDACRQAAALVDAALGTAGVAAPGRKTTQEAG